MIDIIPKGTSTIVCFNQFGEITKEIEVPALVQNVELIVPYDVIKASERVQKNSIQDEIITDLEIQNSLPSIEEARRMIEQNTTAEPAPQDYESRELGLPTLAEIRKRL